MSFQIHESPSFGPIKNRVAILHDVTKFAVSPEKHGALGCGSVCKRDRNANVQEIIQSNYNVQSNFQ